MLNFYSKLTTAFAALAIICSFSASAQCESGSPVTLTLTDSYGDGGGSVTINGEIFALVDAASVSFDLCLDLSLCIDVVYAATDDWPNENAWSISDATEELASGANASGSVGDCGAPGCMDINATNYTSDATNNDLCDYECPFLADGSSYLNGDCYNFVWVIGYDVATVASYGYDCTCVVDPVYGCLEVGNANYNADADFDDCTACSGVSVVVFTAGSFAGENSFTITDCDGAVLASMDVQTGVFNQCIDLLPTLYSVNLTDSYGDTWNGGSLSIDGVTYTLDGESDDGASASLQVGGACPVYGCMDVTAANYDALATVDATSSSDAASLCTYGVPGCVDGIACNYDSGATADDGSCTYAAAGFDCAGNCLVGSPVTLTLTDAWGDGWNGNTLTINGVDYTQANTDPDQGSGSNEMESFEFCLDLSACILVTFNELGSYPIENSWSLSDASGVLASDGPVSGSVGTCIAGCTDDTAFNYDVTAQVDDDSCIPFVYGCMDNDPDTYGGVAVNYDATANVNAVSSTDDADPCTYGIPGCLNSLACNYNSGATADDGTCTFAVTGYDCAGACLSGNPELTVVFTDNGVYDSEASWNITDSSGAIVIAQGNQSGTATNTYCDFDPAQCYMLNLQDDYSDGWGGSGGLTHTLTLNGTSYTFVPYTGVYNTLAGVYVVSFPVGTCHPGCMDPEANNYEPAADIADDSLCTYDCLVGNSYSMDMASPVYSDGTYGATYTISLDGVVVVSGPEDTGNWSTSSDNFCLVDGCYEVSVSTGSNGYAYPLSYYSWTFNGSVFGMDTSGLVSVGETDCILGCTDGSACNYVPDANGDDGSCDYLCIGCMDATAANYDPSDDITINGGCIYCDPGTFVLVVEMTDSGEDTWDGAMYYVTDVNGVNFGISAGGIAEEGSLDTALSGDGESVGTDLLCLAPGCYTFQVSAGVYPGQVGVTLSDQAFGNIYGTIGGDSTLDMDFILSGTCGYEGCTSNSAINFDINATIDDGSCQEPPANDQLSNALPVSCDLDEPYFSGTLLYATDAQGLIGSTFGNADVETAGVWYVYNAAIDKQVVVSTCDTPSNEGLDDTDYTVNTQLHVYTMDLDGSLNAISSNNNGCGVSEPENVESTLSSAAFNTVAAVNYYIYVSKNSGTEGNDFVLSVNCTDNCATDDNGMAIYPSNDYCNDALAQVSGATFTGSTCCASAEALPIGWAGNQSAYGVWFTFNSSTADDNNYDSFTFNITNTGNDVLGFVMMEGNACDTIVPYVGCEFSEVCNGLTSDLGIVLVPNVDYYFLVYTPEPETCGEFEFTTTGIFVGCTDDAASNYSLIATSDDGSCEYVDIDGNVVAPANDTCDNAIELTCNSITTGSTGGASATGGPAGLDNCQQENPGAGVWYTFVGDGQLHSLSTCGSAINSKVSVYSAEIECGGGSVETPDVDACSVNGAVTVNYSVGGGAYGYEISWSLVNDLDETVLSGFGATSLNTLPVCLPEGDYTLNMVDSYGDGWNGNTAVFSNGLGNPILFTSGLGTIPSGSNGTATITIEAYSMEPVLQAGDFTCVISATSSDATGVCDFFNQDDVNLEFISEVGLLYYVYVESETFASSFDLVFDCETVIEACMNDFACNYDATANVDFGCDFHSCVCTTNSGTAIQINMFDSFTYLGNEYGDGWQGQEYSITDSNGEVVASGDINNAQYSVDNDNATGNEYGIDMLCLEPGCYFFDISSGIFDSEVSWNIEMADGSLNILGGADESQSLSFGDSVCGCTDEIAVNYNDLANSDDGSCTYIEGCSTFGACNYNVLVTLDDGSCCYTNCVSINMFDSYGDGWNGGTYVLSTFDGTIIDTGTAENMGGFGNSGAAGTDLYCLASGCYTIDVIGGASSSGEMSWTITGSFGGIQSGVADQSITFNVGSGEECVVGCFVPCACNYDPLVNIIDDAQCLYVGCEGIDGCTYPTATNYDVYDETTGDLLPHATNDDGSCEFVFANPCPADLTGDGSVTTADLLEFLGAFGTICEE